MEDLQIEYIELVFENCESVKLLPNMFHSLLIDKISKGYYINCFQYKNGEVHDYLICNYFHIVIYKTGLKVKTSCNSILYKRLILSNDITNVILHFINGKKEEITVPWDGEQYENLKQKTESNKDEVIITIV